MKVGFIGLGHMGAHMAHNLAKAGHDVMVYDVRPDVVAALVERSPGMHAGHSVAEVAESAEFVGTSLPGPKEVTAVVKGADGLLETMRAGSIYVDLSTNAPSVVRQLAADLKAKGIDMLDAPVSGGERGSEAGTLSVMVGGDEAVWERAQPFLKAVGTKLFYCGPIGAGSVVKLCNNAAALAPQLVLAEVLTLGVKAGVDLKTLASVMGVSSGRSPTLVNSFPNGAFRRKFTGFGFSVALSAKDIGLASDLAHELDVPFKIGDSVRSDLAEAVEDGLGPLDFGAYIQVQEKKTGVELKLSDQEIEEFKKTVNP